MDAAVRNGATRSVFFGGITDTMDEAFFRHELEHFGAVDQVKVLPDKRVAFVHFVAINSALKCVASLPAEDTFRKYKINYGRVRGPSVAAMAAEVAARSPWNALNTVAATFRAPPPPTRGAPRAPLSWPPPRLYRIGATACLATRAMGSTG